jgi:riboflavin kinase/FMN adenylyltransferase
MDRARIAGVGALTRPLTKSVVTIGNFDGVHRGHQEILRLAGEKARAVGGSVVAYTFKPHPHVALRPGGQAAVQLLTTYDERAELLLKHGAALVIEEPFTREFSTIAAEQFFREILVTKLSASAIVVGYDFAFGKERQGSLDSLRKLCAECAMDLTVVPPHREGAEVVSSSRIRQHLLNGDVEAAGRLLGREFFYRGVVVKGEGRGRQLGFPTANLRLASKLALPYGVYATRAVTGDGKTFASVTNLGVRPTFHGSDDAAKEMPVLVETYLLDQQIDLYGTTLEVRFVKRLREERKFAGIEQLKEQIARDVEDSRAILA